jgi:hypothetical protein
MDERTFHRIGRFNHVFLAGNMRRKTFKRCDSFGEQFAAWRWLASRIDLRFYFSGFCFHILDVD